MIRGVIFDADGTLLDSIGFWESTVFDILRISGVTDAPPELIETLTPMTMVQGAHYLRESFNVKMAAEEIIETENKRVLSFYRNEVTLIDGMRGLVNELEKAGIPMVVATATERHMIEDALRHTGILGKFKAVLSCEDIGKGKNEPDIFLKALALLETDIGSALVIDDSQVALETASAAGFMTLDMKELSCYDDKLSFLTRRHGL